MSAVEIFKSLSEIMPLGKLFSGIASSFFVIPIRPDFPWGLQIFFYIFSGAFFVAIPLFANELILKCLKLREIEIKVAIEQIILE